MGFAISCRTAWQSSVHFRPWRAHICCGQCVKVVKGVLEKVDGLADLKIDQKTKTVTFTAKDKKAAEKALAAMYDAGFAGTGKYDDAALKLAATKQSNSKADAVTVTLTTRPGPCGGTGRGR